MEFAAACLSALSRMTPDPTWAPPVGVLFVRIMAAPWCDRITLGYAVEPPGDGLQKTRALAEMRNWHAEPANGCSYECAKGNLDTSNAAPIVRRLANEDDVTAFLRLWDRDCGVSAAAWLDGAMRSRGLAPESVALLRQAGERTNAGPSVAVAVAREELCRLDAEAQRAGERHELAARRLAQIVKDNPTSKERPWRKKEVDELRYADGCAASAFDGARRLAERLGLIAEGEREFHKGSE